MNPIVLFAGICCGLVIMFLIYKFTIGKKKRFAKPQEVQQRVAYDKRYPNRGRILQKEYNLEESNPNDIQED